MDNLWTRRSNNNGKLSLSTGNTGANGASPQNDHPTRNSTLGRRGDHSSHSNKNPFNSPAATALASPTTGASSAFGLGSGAFASFGSSKTPKTPGGALDFGSVVGSSAKTPTIEKPNKMGITSSTQAHTPASTLPPSLAQSQTTKSSSATSITNTISTDSSYTEAYPLKEKWVWWVRPPISKANGYAIDYEDTIRQMSKPIDNVVDFWDFYMHLKRPSELPHVTDYHFFKDGIRPIWEDDDNRNGGKWIIRLRKDVANRYWEDLLLALIGDQFVDCGEEICGAVLSLRNGEDILSVWTRNDGGRNLKIRETMKRLLKLPPSTNFDYKSHNSSLQQRAAVDEARKERSNQHNHNTSVNSRNGNKEHDKVHPSDQKQAS